MYAWRDICLEGTPASLYIDSQVGVYMSPNQLQVGVLVLRLKSWASCRFGLHVGAVAGASGGLILGLPKLLVGHLS